MLQNSRLVVAHPDDECLWFSSILSMVGEVVICFLAVPSEPALTKGRRDSLTSHPLENLQCLEVPESEVALGADWRKPVEADYGVKITSYRFSDKAYTANFAILRERLRILLRGSENVLTHNPWGEYGHVEHVQVYRAVKALQKDLGFDIWFSTYVSNKSAGLMARTLSNGWTGSRTLHTNPPLAHGIAEVYKRNGCWTWYEDYHWPEVETFIRDADLSSAKEHYGQCLNMNLLRTKPPLSLRSRLAKKVVLLRRRLGLRSGV